MQRNIILSFNFNIVKSLQTPLQPVASSSKPVADMRLAFRVCNGVFVFRFKVLAFVLPFRCTLQRENAQGTFFKRRIGRVFRGGVFPEKYILSSLLMSRFFRFVSEYSSGFGVCTLWLVVSGWFVWGAGTDRRKAKSEGVLWSIFVSIRSKLLYLLGKSGYQASGVRQGTLPPHEKFSVGFFESPPIPFYYRYLFYGVFRFLVVFVSGFFLYCGFWGRGGQVILGRFAVFGGAGGC